MDFSPEGLRSRFAELTEQRDAITAVLQPLRDELDAIAAGDTELSVKAAREREEIIRPQIKELQSKLAPIDSERAIVARAWGSKPGLF